VSTVQRLEDQALSRATGADLIHGNRLRLLNDAAENYPAWLEAIQSAQKWVHFESYIIHEDPVGNQFADLLIAKAREGVPVRLLYDWVGSLGNASRRFWKRLAAGGVDVRCFNPPRLESPFGWACRDHRKLISIDGRLAYISGLCVGQRWVGYPEKGIDGWRDTGVEIQGPALREIEQSFADTWAVAGSSLPPSETQGVSGGEAGDVEVRIVASAPSGGNVYRLDQLVTGLARRSIWLADAYFVGTSSYVQALRSAAQSGVDVRLLIPGANDVPVMRSLSRAGLRPLLEAGIRVFEWNGPMMHAKTAVVDGYRARIGSTNLNLNSWLGNWELDVLFEDKRLAGRMEQDYMNDISRSTEIVLENRRRRLRSVGGRTSGRRTRRASGPGRAAAGVMRLSHAVEAAIINSRPLGPAEAVIMFWGAALLAGLAAVAVLAPKVVVYPFAILCVWLALSLSIRAFKLRFARNQRRRRRIGNKSQN
jgi:cardiolipin synthase